MAGQEPGTFRMLLAWLTSVMWVLMTSITNDGIDSCRDICMSGRYFFMCSSGMGTMGVSPVLGCRMTVKSTRGRVSRHCASKLAGLGGRTIPQGLGKGPFGRLGGTERQLFLWPVLRPQRVITLQSSDTASLAGRLGLVTFDAASAAAKIVRTRRGGMHRSDSGALDSTNRHV